MWSCSDLPNIRHYFDQWSKMSPQKARTVRLQSCQTSAFTFTSMWYHHNNKLQLATNSKEQEHYSALALRDRGWQGSFYVFLMYQKWSILYGLTMCMG